MTIRVDDKLTINFPYSMEDISSTKEGFHQIAGFQNVVGTIDGTQVAIIAPSGETEPLFVCTKGFHSINVQMLEDRMAGSQSALLGDSGYPLKTWLMVPFTNPSSRAGDRYNNVHKRT
ncbi:putative nuclease HARBI1 [Patella vulgata]|uniref:putative nuclease HARBI1 n=1 Tax=Patella vulgata TaxID=6465 RepID=UPI0024A7BC4B|nr:putative nuclease HARBI1 [Patella vulgata]